MIFTDELVTHQRSQNSKFGFFLFWKCTVYVGGSQLIPKVIGLSLELGLMLWLELGLALRVQSWLG